MTRQTAVEDSAAIKVAEDAVTGPKQPLSATDIEIAIGYRLPQWSMELLLRLLQQRDEEVTRHLHAENERLTAHIVRQTRELDRELIPMAEQLQRQNEVLLDALRYAEEGLADIGDADREPGDDLAWCEARAAEALPRARAAIKTAEEAATQPSQQRGALSEDEVRPVLAHSRQALLSVLGCYPLEHDKRPGAAQARSALQQIDRLMNESVERNPIAPALTPEPVSVRLTLRTAEGREGQETLGSGTPLSWDRDGDDETVTAFFELLHKTKGGRNVVCGGHEIDGDAWRELESQGDPELVLLAVRNDVPLVQAVTAALEAARRSQQQPRER